MAEIGRADLANCDLREIDVHVTGYYEPEFHAARSPNATQSRAIYRLPARLSATRREIEEQQLLAGLEIAWLDPLDAFFLQVQGSGRLIFADGMLRVGYAGKNGHPYVSIGKILIERGAIAAAEISPDTIRAWCADHPKQAQALLWENTSFVCFQPLDLPPELGPLGALGVPLRPLRSVAVDPALIPLGSLLWLDFAGHRGLALAQDIGSAIVGARVDLFCGTGIGAGQRAGGINTPGRAAVFAPKERP